MLCHAKLLQAQCCVVLHFNKNSNTVMQMCWPVASVVLRPLLAIVPQCAMARLSIGYNLPTVVDLVHATTDLWIAGCAWWCCGCWMVCSVLPLPLV